MSFFDPANSSGAVFWGVVSGILTSGLLLLLGVVFTRIVVPWLEALRFQGVDLSGVWRYSQTLGGIEYDYVMNLAQRAHRLNGAMTISKRGAPAGPRGDYVQGFNLSGSTWESFVTLNMKSADRRSLAFATSLLQIRDRGNSLVGQLSYRTSLEDKVGSEDVHWTRA